jgi:N-acetylglucosamine-6-phosphate deacetylase
MYLENGRRAIRRISMKRPEALAYWEYIWRDPTLLQVNEVPIHSNIVTMAPELPGASKVIEELTTKHGIVVSMGHTDATMQQGKEGMASGATLLTHLFNAMRPFHHREPGLLGLLAGNNNNTIGSSPSSQEKGHKRKRTTNTNRPYYSLICDGLHSHSTSVQMATSLHPKGAILVTDAMAAMGLGDGQHMLGTESVVVKGMRATLAHQPETLAGSVSSMDRCVKSFFDFTQCTPGEAIAAATSRPAHLLKLDDRIGKVQKGHKADLVLLESTTLSVLNTWINGNMVFNGNSLVSS